MTNDAKEKTKSAFLTALPYASAVVLAVALCGLLYAAGKLTTESIIAILAAVAALLGLKKFNDGSGAAGGAAVLIASAVLLSGCAAWCDGIARADAAMGEAEEALPIDPEPGSVAAKLREVLALARNVALTGIRICDDTLDLVRIEPVEPAGPKPDEAVGAE